MMKMLAGMPHMMRKPMMKGRINQLLSLSEEPRQESIRDMIEAFHSSKVNSKARESLVATRVEIVGELSADKRRTIISSRSEALKVAPELDRQDRDVQKKIFSKFSKSTRDAFQSACDQVHS
jgi:Mg/Co/Ni transporter MgtE